jgi:predicted nucleic acid-binding protein
VVITVVYDANVLYPAALRDLLVGLAQVGLVRARWSERILDECFRNILASRPDLDAERLRRTRDLMNRAVRDVLVTGYERLVPAIELPDPDDRHVLAAAVRAGAQGIVTFNLRDFPKVKLAPLGLQAMHPDDFVLGVLQRTPLRVADVVLAQSERLKNPPRSVTELLALLAEQGLPPSAGLLRDMFSRDR